MNIGVIAGSAYQFGDDEFPLPEENEFGQPSSGILTKDVEGGRLLILLRHGDPPRIPPHRVNHASNVKSLIDAGANMLLGVCSSGALRPEIPVPCIAIPGDFIDLWSGSTIFSSGIYHATPAFDKGLITALEMAAEHVDANVMKGGVYIQTRGPRLETKAEVRMLSSYGDYVGMNLGSEASIASELGIPFAGLLTADNYAHGVKEAVPDFRDIISSSSSKWELLFGIISSLPSHLGSE
ncbi:MAG: MTAP family purine nucleoside phosphorylase [Candidatus Thermoplasmatota archaeon]|nr:MTAP family purine nucleoside phosphorylase [Candidatus Thermoplasmatota archaeon]